MADLRTESSVPPFAGAAPGVEHLRIEPNPSTGSPTVSFRLADSGPVSLRVYDAAGRLVRTLARGALSPGPHAFIWNGASEDGTHLLAGAYFQILESPGRSERVKAVMLR